MSEKKLVKLEPKADLSDGWLISQGYANLDEVDKPLFDAIHTLKASLAETRAKLAEVMKEIEAQITDGIRAQFTQWGEDFRKVSKGQLQFEIDMAQLQYEEGRIIAIVHEKLKAAIDSKDGSEPKKGAQ